MAKHSKDTDVVELFHEHGLHVASRTIVLDTSYNGDEGDEDGVNHYMATKFLKNLHLLEAINQNPITIILNTAGGSCVDGMAVYDAIKASSCLITIKVFGQASSMGSIILQAADRRVLSPNASVMFHIGTAGVGATNPVEAANAAIFDKKWMERMRNIQLERINEKRQSVGQSPMTKAKFTDMNHEGGYLFADEAVALGLADTIE